MSEKIYAFMLRLYPARFRERFETEALQLIRDRLKEERGWLPRLRLGMDLIKDFATGLSQAYRNTYASPATAAVALRGAGLPVFATLQEEPLRPGSIVMGSISATAALAFFIFVMSHAPVYHSFKGAMGRLRAAPAGTESNPDTQAAEEKLDEQVRSAIQLKECSFEKLEQHPGNVGYVKLSWFADPALCGGVADAVMYRLNETNAVIFDLRDTRGGYPEMVRRMAGWLFDHPVAWYNPRAKSAAQQTTVPAPESQLAKKPVFVLTSSRTFSGAEHFAYNLKALKRATIVGERTSGASHAGSGGAPSRIAVSEPKPIWEGTGVEPDVKVSSADALRTAEGLALNALHVK